MSNDLKFFHQSRVIKIDYSLEKKNEIKHPRITFEYDDTNMNTVNKYFGQKYKNFILERRKRKFEVNKPPI